MARMPPALDYIDEVGVFHYPYVTNTWPGSEWELSTTTATGSATASQGVDTVLGAWLRTPVASVGRDQRMLPLRLLFRRRRRPSQVWRAAVLRRLRKCASGIWPGFWFLSDGNGNLGRPVGLHLLALHEPGLVQRLRRRRPTVSRRQTQNGLQAAFYVPDSFFVNAAAQEPAPKRTIVHDTHPADDWHPGMACASTEELLVHRSEQRPRHRKVPRRPGGTISTNLQFNTGRGMWWGSSPSRVIATRRSVMGVYALNFLGPAMQAVTFYMPEQQIRYYGGTSSTAG